MKKTILLLQLFMAIFLYAEETIDITDGHIIWETIDGKKFKPIIKCSLDMHGIILTVQNTDVDKAFILTEGGEIITDFDYYFYFYDYKLKEKKLIYKLQYNELTRDIKCAYYNNDTIYCLEVEKKRQGEDCFITKRNINSTTILEEYRIKSFYSPKKYQYAQALYVDEKNNRILCIYSKYIENNHLQKYLKVLSLTTGEELFCHDTDLGNIFIEDKNVFLSVKNRLYKVDYCEDSFELIEIKTFIPKKETIIAMQKNNDIYIIRTEYWKFNLALKFLFGNNSQIWSYYACKFQDEKLQKIKKLKEPKK